MLGPVPSIAEQTAALMRDPSYLVQELRRAQDTYIDGPEPTDDQFFAGFEDEPDEHPIFTGHETVFMDPITPPAEPDPAGAPPDSPAAAQEPHAEASESTANPEDAAPAHSGPAP